MRWLRRLLRALCAPYRWRVRIDDFPQKEAQWRMAERERAELAAFAAQHEKERREWR